MAFALSLSLHTSQSLKSSYLSWMYWIHSKTKRCTSEQLNISPTHHSASLLLLCPHQEACLQGNLIANCLEQLSDPHPLLRQWVAICLGRIWQNFDPARWCGVRDSAHEKLYTLLSDPIPEVRG